MGTYGRYGIGLSKKWAFMQGLNPVLYMSKDCPATSAFVKAVESLYDIIDKRVDGEAFINLNNNYADILNLFRYIKNYEGDLKRPNKKTISDHRFAEEREWRYVPPMAETVFPFIPINRVQTTKQKADLNALLTEIRLTFHPDDIRYLIIEKDSERLDLLDHIKYAKRGFDLDTQRRLSSRILTADQITNDM